MFRETEPNGAIETEVTAVSDLIIVKAFVIIDGTLKATGHATVRSGQNQKWAGREIEKAETAAIGRALAHAGFGTQFAFADMDEGDYLADSPVEQKQSQPAHHSTAQTAKPQTSDDSVTQFWVTVHTHDEVTKLYDNSNHRVNAVFKVAKELGISNDDLFAKGADFVIGKLIERKKGD
jgi:hypothetical protein